MDRGTESPTTVFLILVERDPKRVCSYGLYLLVFTVSEIKTKKFKLKHTFQ